jgi:hypothetical protein
MPSPIVDAIRSRGYWDVTVHPARRLQQPLQPATLLDTLTRNAVRMRGWPVPFIDYRLPPLRTKNSVGQDIDAQSVDHYEAWRFTTDAQFSQLRSVSADWRKGAERTAVPRGARAVIEVWEIVFYITELAELAARLALLSGADAFHLAAELHGMADRALVAGMPGRELDADYVSQLDAINDARTVSVQQLTASPPQVAVDMSAALLAGFGWHAKPDVLRDFQAVLLRGHSTADLTSGP